MASGVAYTVSTPSPLLSFPSPLGFYFLASMVPLSPHLPPSLFLSLHLGLLFPNSPHKSANYSLAAIVFPCLFHFLPVHPGDRGRPGRRSSCVGTDAPHLLVKGQSNVSFPLGTVESSCSEPAAQAVGRGLALRREVPPARGPRQMTSRPPWPTGGAQAGCAQVAPCQHLKQEGCSL